MDYFLGHLIGDFILQNDWLACKKKKSHLACLLHCFIYTLSVVAFTKASWGVFSYLLILTSHFLIDRWKLMIWFFRIARKPNFGKPPLAPWSYIIVDNIFHLLILYTLSPF